MDPARLAPRDARPALAAPVVEAAPVNLPPAAPAPVTPDIDVQGQPVTGTLDQISLDVLATVRPCSAAVKAPAARAARLDRPESARPAPRRGSTAVLVGAALAVAGGVAWLLTGARGTPSVGRTSAAPVAPAAPMPAHVPTPSSPLNAPELRGFVVVGS